MKWLESLSKIAEKLNEFAPFLEALDVLAFVGIFATIFAATRRKSYEIMIQHRLASLDKIRQDMAQLLYMFSVEGMTAYKAKSNDIQAYNAEIRKLMCALHMEIKPLDTEDIELWQVIDDTWVKAQKYFTEPIEANGEALTVEIKKLQDKYDLYDWALWLYDQQLHKVRKNITKLFKRAYKKVEKQKQKAETAVKSK